MQVFSGTTSRLLFSLGIFVALALPSGWWCAIAVAVAILTWFIPSIGTAIAAIIILCSGAVPGLSLLTLFSSVSALSFKFRIRCAYDPFLTLLWIWIAFRIGFEFDPALVSALLRSSDPSAAARSLFSAAPPAAYQILISGARWISLYLLITLLHQRRELMLPLVNGSLLGSLLAAGVAVIQSAAYSAPTLISLPDWLPKPTDFWLSQHRFAGLATDPNALGLILFLASVLTIRGSSRQRWTVLPIYLAAALVSGSRTFLLGILLLLLLTGYQRSPRKLLPAILLLAATILGINLLPPLFPESYSYITAQLPSGLQRLVDTVNLDSAYSSFFSRNVFLQIGWQIFTDNPLIGCGFGRFSELFPAYAAQLQLGTGLWSDNPNNFYLGILAELGIIGAISLVLTIRRFRFDPAAEPGLKNGITVFLCLLLLGPHLEFPETTLLFAILIGCGTLRRPAPINGAQLLPPRLVPLLYVLLGTLIFSRLQNAERGFYPWEGDNNAPFRWSRGAAVHLTSCGTNHSATVPFEIVVPPSLQGPGLKLTVKSTDFEFSQRYHSSQPLVLSIPCAGKFTAVSIAVTPLWSPKVEYQSADPRWLGVKVLNPPAVSSLNQ